MNDPDQLASGKHSGPRRAPEQALSPAGSYGSRIASLSTDFRIIGELCRGEHYVVYRAQRVADGKPKLLKSTSSQPGRRALLDALRREYSLLSELDAPGFIRVDALLEDSSGCWIIMEDPGASPLRTVMAAGPVDLAVFFKLVLQLTAALAELHRRDLIHRDVQPASILVDPNTLELWLINLAWASGAEGEVQSPIHSADRLGELYYLSPEQTGRTNRSLDHRTDLYSLGVTCYELLTGVLPFRSTDALQLIHAHIAKTPAAPRELRPQIPEVIGRIVLKLLEKMPESRYQSASGLRADLEQCALEWNSRREITLTELGARDVPERLLIPQRLYGRQQALDSLTHGFHDACMGSSRMMLVAGYAGVGKTALIKELYPWIARQQAYFIAGKFDQVVRNIPHGAVLQAFRALVRQILSESDERFAAWRNRLAEALGPNAGVLSEVIPEIALIVGDVPACAPLPAAEAQNRFRLVFQNFVGALADAEHPLVLFLDDLQWADPASLALLQPLLTSSEVRYFFMIGAFRDNEVGTAHVLTRTLADLDASGAAIERIELAPLARGDLERFAADCLRREDEKSRWLAELLARKTEGNPFFVIQFLTALWRDGLLRFDDQRRFWRFIKGEISEVPMTDNVIDLMSRRIERLSPSARRSLTFAACIGNTFELRTLSVVSQLEPDALVPSLREAQEEGLILRMDSAEDRHPQSYAFIHDRVQQAAYAQLEAERRQRLHLAVGRLLLADWDSASAEEKLFDVIEHLNIGSVLITAPDERMELAGLNYQAGLKAKSATAYQAAATYFSTGVELLSADCWDSDYRLMFELHIEAAECAYLCGEFEAVERRFDALIFRAASVIDKARVYALRVVQYENMSRYATAAAIAAEGLAMLGISFPVEDAACQLAIDSEIEGIDRQLAGRSIESLISLPDMEDAEIRMAMRLLTVSWASSYISAEGIPAALISARMVALSIEFGNTPDSAYGYVTHAITVGPRRGDYASAYEWGRLALAVNERFGDQACRAKIHQQFNAHVTLWRKPLQSCITHAREACRVGLQNGDFTYAAYGAFTESWPAFLLARDLERFVREMEPNLRLLKKIRTAGIAAVHRVMLQWAGAFLGRTVDPVSLSGQGFRETDYVRHHGDNPFFMTVYLTAKLHLAVLFDDPDEALQAKARAQQIGWGHGTIWPVLVRFWGALVLTRQFEHSTADTQQEHWRELGETKDFLALLAENCPENFRCMLLILNAELTRLQRDYGSSFELLEEAIDQARQSGNLQHEALAQELAGRLWLARGNETVARSYLMAARDSYADLGAVTKVGELASRYPRLLSGNGEGAGLPVDIDSVSRAARAVAEEIVLDSLLQKIISIAMENAGARRAFFIQECDGQLVIEAEANVDSAAVTVLESRHLDTSAAVAVRVINYVRKTHERVVVGNTATDNRFASDPYIVSSQPKSIVCMPMTHQGRLGGILYLENDLGTDAFTDRHLKVLEVLCAQAAISLENARLYREMRDEIERRKAVEENLRAALGEVESLKNRLKAENVYLQEEIKSGHNYEEIVGSSPMLLQLLHAVDRVAPTESTVLISGETGTGKELIARALHNRSTRKDRPLVKVNCGAISAGLVESELFGHVKGAFTGALSRRVGRFELADGGTIFLDEVGELPADVQVKLLRVLQEQEFEPVGSNKTVRVDVRVIAATNRNLEDQIRLGRFRADLFYRLNVIPLTVPPLRDRHEDIAALAMYFLERHARTSGSGVCGIAPETMRMLRAYRWPGNVRELQNVIERAVVLSHDSVLRLDPQVLAMVSRIGTETGIDSGGGDGAPVSTTPRTDRMASMEEMERRHILAALERSHWVIEGPTGAAQILQRNPSTLRSRMKKLGIVRTH